MARMEYAEWREGRAVEVNWGDWKTLH